MKKYRDPVPWRDIGRLATVLGVALIVYTVAVALASPDQLFDWLNTLVATVLSVFSALVVGLVLLRLQTKEADAKKREELAGRCSRRNWWNSNASLRTLGPSYPTASWRTGCLRPSTRSV